MKHLNFLSSLGSQSGSHRVVTLASTVGSPSAHRRGAMLKHVAFLLLFLFAGFGQMWGTEGATHDFSQSVSAGLNNNASINSINIPSQSYPVKEVKVAYSYNNKLKGDIVTISVSVGGTSFGSFKIVSSSTSGKTSGTQSFKTSPQTSVSGAITVSFTNHTGNGTGHGTLTVSNVQLVEGATAGPTLYTVTLDANEGNVTPTSVTQASEGASVTLPTPTREGYTCNGWYTTTSGGTKRANAGASYTPTTSETVHAQWTANNYTVAWSVNGSSWTNGVSASNNNADYNTTVSAPAGAGNVPTTSNCDGSKVFVGWTATPIANATNTAPSDLFTTTSPAITENTTFYAVFATQSGGGSGSEELTSSELTTNITNTTCAYGIEKTWKDNNKIDYAFSVSTDAASRPWVQMKKGDITSYIGITAPGNISKVELTITAAANSSGGVTDISKHTKLPDGTTLNLNTSISTNSDNAVASASGDGSSTAMTINVSNPSNSTLYLQPIGGACRIWGIKVYYSNITYSAYSTDCCQPLGSINGSVTLTQLTSGDNAGKLQATWPSQSTTDGWAEKGIQINIYEDGNATPKVTSSALDNSTTSFTATGFTPKTCTQYYATLTAIHGGSSTYCAGNLVSDLSTKVTTAGYTYDASSSTHVSLVDDLPESTCANGGVGVEIQFTATAGYRLPSTDEEIEANVSVTNAGEKDEDWFCSFANDVLTISIDPTKATGNIGIEVEGIYNPSPEIIVNKTEIDFSEVKKGTQTSTTFTVEGAHLSNNITLSSDEDAFTLSSYSLTQVEGSVALTTITLTANTSTAGDYAGTITISDGNDGATDKTIDVYLTVLETYTVNFYINGGEYPSATQTDVVGTTLNIPSDFSEFTDCSSFTFLGWKDGSAIDGGSSTTAPDLAEVGTQITAANKNYYAVFAEGTPGGYAKVTAVNQLAANDKVVITYNDEKGMKAYNPTSPYTNYYDTANIVVADGKITKRGNACEFTLGGEEDAWTFYDGTYYAYAAGSAKNGGGYNNNMKGKTALGEDHACEWTIAIENGVTSITSNTNTATPNMRYNTGSPRFSCYNSGQSEIDIYRKTAPVWTKYYTTCPGKVAKPSITGVTDGTTYEVDKEITISCGTANATIYYTTNNTEPTTSSTVYTDPFTLSDNGSYTIRAIAVKEGMTNSDEATAVSFTIDKPYTTIASFIAAEPTNKKLVLTGAKVLGTRTDYLYVQDATGGIQLYKSSHGLTFASGKTLSGYIIGTYSNNSSSAYMPRLTFTDGSTMSVTEDEPALPDATVITAGSDAKLCQLVKLENVKFQSTSLSSNTVYVQKSDLDIDTVYNTFGVLDQTLPNSATSCDVTGVLIKYSGKYEIAPLSVDGISTKGASAILPTFSTTGSTDSENPTAVAEGKVITITPAAGMTSTYKDGTADVANLTEATNVTIDVDKAIVVTASAYYYTDNTATYYYHADQSLTEHTISKAAMTNGEVTVKIGEDEVSSAAQNATIRLLVAPSANYHMTEISVTDAEDGNVALTEVTAGEEYTFTMPAKAVTVSATFEEDAYAIVTFVKGNESADGIAPSSFKKYVGQIATMPGKNTLAYVGYDFAGWTYGGNDYAENDIYTIQAEDAAIGGKTINFEAKWIAWPDEASIYTSNIIKQGVNTPDAKVVLEDEEEYDAWKIAKGSSITLTIPAGTTTIYGHLVAWKGESANVTISGSCFSSNIVLTPAADDGISNNSPFTLVANGSTFYFKLTPDEAITQDVNITFTATSNKRAVVYGVNAIFPQITLSPASYDFENVRANQTKQQVFTITQNENVTGTLSASITNDATGKYSVSDIEDNKVTVTFDPNGASSGTFTAKLRIAASNAIVTADLTGTAIGAEAPEIVVNKNAVAFGQVDPNASVSEAIAVQLLHIDGAVSAALSGDDAGKFTLSATSFTEDGVLTITPTTSAQGIFSATLTLSAKDVENIDIPISITVASKWAVTYTSNIALTTEGGTNASTAKVVINSTQYDAIKAGTGSGAGAVRITVPKHTKFLHIHAAAWTGESPTLTITGASTTPSALTLTADEGVSNNSPFTLQNSPIGQIFDVAIPDSETPTTITLTADGGNNKKRFVIYGVNQEGGVIEITESTNISTLGDVENQPIVASGEGVVLTVNVPTTAGSIAATNGATIKITEATTASDVVVDENSKIELTATVTAPVFRICTAPGQQATSGQVTGVSHVAAESIIMDVQLLEAGYMDADYWYSISAPFDVNVAGGFMTTGGRVLIHNVDFQIWSYAPDLYANGGRSWRRCADGVMHKNAAYLIGFDPVRFDNGIVPNVVRLKAAENTTLDDEVNTINDLQTQTSATLKPGYAWNGVANPNVYHINVGRDVQLWDNYSHGFLPATVGNNGLLDHDSYSFVVGTPFFCKDDGTHRIAITAATHVTEYTIPNEAPARNAAERYSFCVQIRKPGSRYYENRLYVRASEDALATFEDGKDMETLNETCNGHALIWTNAYGKRLAIEDAPLTNNQAMYDLTIMTPAAGTYVLRQANEVDGADLYVTYGGQIVWNLSLGDYELDLTRGTTTGYGLLLVVQPNQMPTGVENGELLNGENGVQKILLNGNLYILRDGHLYDAVGKQAR